MANNNLRLSTNTNPKLNPILPINGVPDQLISVLNDRFREIRLAPASVPPPASNPGITGAAGPFQRTLLVRNTAVANDVADHLTCWGPSAAHTVVMVRAVLRKTITSDLTVRINSVNAGVTSVIGTFTIPLATAIDTPVDFSGFTTSSLPDSSIFTWDITASDGSADPAGVASFTIEWEP